MEISFNVKNSRLDELKKFIRENLPSVRFKSNPFKLNSNEFQISLSLDVKDSNKLNYLLNDWYLLDNPSERKVTIFDKLKNIIKNAKKTIIRKM